MYIENNNGTNYLVKKVLGKKISVKIADKISSNDIENISEKEFNLISSIDSYKQFQNQLFDKISLDKIIKKETLIYNLWESEIDSKVIKNYEEFPIKFIYESNKTEGSKIPFEELENILKNKKYTYKVKNEIQEVKNSIKTWEFLKTKFVFNEANIKRLYHNLTKNLLQEEGTKYPRGFKKVNIVVNNSSTINPENVQLEINKLLNFYKNNKNKIFSLQLSFDFHLWYEKIHPFENGNGRTGRLLMNKILLSSNMLPIIIFSDNRQAYFNAIKSTDERNYKKYYTFMLEQYDKTLDYFQY